MELMQLEMFVAVVEERSVGKAAARVHRTQPAVSIAIARLEGEIGVAVLDRSRALDYRPSPAGEILYDYATRILGLRNEASEILKGQDRTPGQLRIGVGGAGSLEKITQLIEGFRGLHSEIGVEILSHCEGVVLKQLLDRKLDLGFLFAIPDSVGSNADLVLSHFDGNTGGSGFWAVERRVGRSYAAKLFSEALRGLRRDPPLQNSRKHVLRIVRRTRRPGTERARVGPVK